MQFLAKKFSGFKKCLVNNCSKLNRFVPIFLTIYFLLISTPYIFAAIPALDSFFSNSLSSYILRFIYLIIYILFGLMLLFGNNIKVKPVYPIVFGIVFISFLINAFITPKSISSFSFYFSGKVSYHLIQIGLYDFAIHLGRFLGDLLFLFFFICVYCKCFRSKKDFYLIALVPIIISLIAVIYSLLFERDYVISVFNGGGYTEKIKSIFHSKNEFGIFLFEGSVGLSFIIFTSGSKKRLFLFVGLIIFCIMSLVCSCKLCFICVSCLIITLITFLIFNNFLSHKIRSIIAISSVLCIAIFFTLVMCVSSFSSISFLNNMKIKLTNLFSTFTFNSLFGRMNEWDIVKKLVTGANLVFGVFPATGYQYVSLYTSMNGVSTQNVYDLHNAYLDFFAYHGIIGVLFYLLIFVYVFYKMRRIDPKSKIVLVSILVCSILFGMAETYTLFISMSANTFLLTVIVLGYSEYRLSVCRSKQLGVVI